MYDYLKEELLKVFRNCLEDIPPEKLKAELSQANITDEEFLKFKEGVGPVIVCKNVERELFEKYLQCLRNCGLVLEEREYCQRNHDGKYDLTVTMGHDEHRKLMEEAERLDHEGRVLVQYYDDMSAIWCYIRKKSCSCGSRVHRHIMKQGAIYAVCNGCNKILAEITSKEKAELLEKGKWC